MEKELKETKKFSEAEYERYMAGKSNQLLFSPGNIVSEVQRIINSVGLQELLSSGKYKRLREMEIAARFCIANFKETGDRLMIMPQDNPDIILALPDDGSTKHTKVLPVEVMTIPEIAKEKFSENLPNEIADFIAKKKFNKAYGEMASLLIGFNFTQEALNFNEISLKLNQMKRNPYHSIFATFTSSADGRTMSVMQLYPGLAIRKDYNLEHEQYLLY
jgi:hypothetical protein